MKSKKAKSLLRINLKLCFILILCAYPIYSQQTDSTLQKAYRYNSGIILDEFFMNWENDSKLTDSERQYINQRIDADDTLKEVYEIAKEFYLPVYTETKYFLIEDTLKYQVCYSESVELCETYNYQGRINIFFPLRFDSDDRRILYLDSKYNQILYKYFSSNETDIYNLGEIYEAKREIFNEKLNFYGKKLLGFKPEHYSKSDFLIPALWDIFINKNLDKALLRYRVGFLSYEISVWQKINDNWQFIKVVGQGGY